MSDCEHDWRADPLAGSDTFARYKCAACGQWGWRAFGDNPSGKLRPVRPYNPPVYEARKDWFRIPISRDVESGERREYAEKRDHDVAADAFSEDAFEAMLRDEAGK